MLLYPAYLTNPIPELKPDPALDQAHITPERTPPTFITVVRPDKFTVGCASYFAALRQAKVPAELHVWSSGGHGGMFDRYPLVGWGYEGLRFLHDHKFLDDEAVAAGRAWIEREEAKLKADPKAATPTPTARRELRRTLKHPSRNSRSPTHFPTIALLAATPTPASYSAQTSRSFRFGPKAHATTIRSPSATKLPTKNKTRTRSPRAAACASPTSRIRRSPCYGPTNPTAAPSSCFPEAVTDSYRTPTKDSTSPASSTSKASPLSCSSIACRSREGVPAALQDAQARRQPRPLAGRGVRNRSRLDRARRFLGRRPSRGAGLSYFRSAQ
ncbi:MAG: hypothetical protein QM775_03905 [Pirellulales bacterium]